MAESPRGAWLEIDLAAVEHNVGAMVRHVAPAELMAVLKADACGHGLEHVACSVIKAGAHSIAVASVDEAVRLRDIGIKEPVHLLGYAGVQTVKDLVAGEFVVSPKGEHLARALSDEAISQGKRVKVHIEVDTGLGRWGVPAGRLPAYVDFIGGLPGLEVEGIYTHFANLDAGDYPDTERAFQEFMQSADLAERMMGKRLLRHVSNTLATLLFRKMHLDMVRPGVGLYGIMPLAVKAPIPLRPALCLKSRIAALRSLGAGQRLGYGSTYQARVNTVIAVVPLGFGDGLPPQLGGRGEALVKGRRVPIVGRVSTDAVTLDVGHLPSACMGDEVVFIGTQGEARISAEEIAGSLGTFVDPILINLGRGLGREYRRGRAGVERCSLEEGQFIHFP